MIKLNFYQTKESAGSRHCSCCTKEMLDGSISIMTFGPVKRTTQFVLCVDCLRALKGQVMCIPKDGEKVLNEQYLESPERTQLDRVTGAGIRYSQVNGGTDE